ncbi:hypothetical protein BpHYR1_001072 [Brachionus plicatilis]|uniref:Uncharacterized protein n=1 Tax=Brachionus plicatilis TaxID=10195 RepID=A0A3M7QNT8_BRAPC|nr:hypothetical protein BpHYR1_001072 [Brachionus plicatilis]
MMRLPTLGMRYFNLKINSSQVKRLDFKIFKSQVTDLTENFQDLLHKLDLVRINKLKFVVKEYCDPFRFNYEIFGTICQNLLYN